MSNYLHKSYRLGIFLISIYWLNKKFSIQFDITTDNWK
jgi:hypothetical protein